MEERLAPMIATVTRDRLATVLRGLTIGLLAVYMPAPMVVVVVISFSSAAFLHFPPPGFSLQWYRRIFANEAWTSSLLTSVEVMLPTALLATTLGTAAAGGLARSRCPVPL
jgi:putative spermidine/putrescine transport system permease protein